MKILNSGGSSSVNYSWWYQLYYMWRNFGHWRAEFILGVFVTCQSSVKNLADHFHVTAKVQKVADKTMTPRQKQLCRSLSFLRGFVQQNKEKEG